MLEINEMQQWSRKMVKAMNLHLSETIFAKMKKNVV